VGFARCVTPVEPNVVSGYSIETSAWDQDGKPLIKTYYPTPVHVGAESDSYAHLLDGGATEAWFLACHDRPSRRPHAHFNARPIANLAIHSS
jgi:hypothetical protein